VVIAFASVLAPVTVRLDVPVEFVIAGLVPFMTKLPTVSALLCRSSVALLRVSNELVLPKLPLP
jgi:hypothetical protein